MLRIGGDGGARPEGPKPEARRAEAGVGFLGRGAAVARPLLILVLFEPRRTRVETTIV